MRLEISAHIVGRLHRKHANVSWENGTENCERIGGLRAGPGVGRTEDDEYDFDQNHFVEVTKILCYCRILQ